MRFVVIDASVAVKWYVAENDSEKAVALLDADNLLFLAPDIFLAEVVNALLRQRRNGQLTKEALERALGDLTFSAPELIASTRLIDRAAALPQTLAHPVYDCLYLALAERWETVLVTADIEFIKRCQSRIAGDPVTSKLRLLANFEP
jgi:predicted nucleic acid-binding protein